MNEGFKPFSNGTGGVYFTNGANGEQVKHTIDNWKTMNSEANFVPAVKEKGNFALFALTHNIGTDFYNEEDRSVWLGSESFYDEDHFFYISGIPELGGRTPAFQLRVSDHIVKPSQWEQSHSNGIISVPKQWDASHSNGEVETEISRLNSKNKLRTRKMLKREGLMADFCLNLMFDKKEHRLLQDKEKSDDNFYKNPESVNIGIINCDCDYYQRDREGQQKVDEIIRQITSGEQPTIPYETLKSLFGNCEFVSYGTQQDFRPHNFTKRDNMKKVYRGEKPYEYLPPTEPTTQEPDVVKIGADDISEMVKRVIEKLLF